MLGHRLIGTATIALGGTDSSVLELTGRERRISIQTPAALTAAVTLQGTNENVAAPTYQNVQVAGVDVAVAAAKLIVMDTPACRTIRFKSAGAEAAARDFIVIAIDET